MLVLIDWLSGSRNEKPYHQELAAADWRSPAEFQGYLLQVLEGKVALPAALFARGLSGRLASVNPMTAALGFLVWQMVKLALTMAMLFAAPRLVVALSWPALLVGLVLALKVYWVALRFAPRNVKQQDE